MEADNFLPAEAPEHPAAHWAGQLRLLVDQVFVLVDDIHAAFDEYELALIRDGARGREPKAN